LFKFVLLNKFFKIIGVINLSGFAVLGGGLKTTSLYGYKQSLGVNMKISSLFVFIVCFSIIAFAQSDNYKTKALSFSFNGLNLSSYYGGVGGRIWVSDNTVLNASIGGYINETDYDKTETLDKGIQKNKSLTIGIGLENHLQDFSDFSPYFSTRISYSHTDQYYRSSSRYFLQDNKTNSINLDFGFGIEYWIDKRISLSGQHLFYLGYNKGEQSMGYPNDENQNTKGFQLGFGTTSIILSIYF